MTAFELSFEFEKIRALVKCLDDAVTNAVTDNPSEAGDRALCLVDFLQEHLDVLMASVEGVGRDAA